MIDFNSLFNNQVGSSITNIIIISLVSFVLSSLVALIYEKTSQEMEKPRFFIQSLILISAPVAMAMQAIGDSLAHGLGLLGALAIIRFRTTIRNTRNIVFMFFSITIGIATGVYGISIAIIGTLFFGLIVVLIHFSHLSKNNYIIGHLQFQISNEENQLAPTFQTKEITDIIDSSCQKTVLMAYKKQNDMISSFEYQIRIVDQHTGTNLVNEITGKFKLINVKLTFVKNDYEKI